MKLKGGNAKRASPASRYSMSTMTPQLHGRVMSSSPSHLWRRDKLGIHHTSCILCGDVVAGALAPETEPCRQRVTVAAWLVYWGQSSCIAYSLVIDATVAPYWRS